MGNPYLRAIALEPPMISDLWLSISCMLTPKIAVLTVAMLPT